LLTLRAATEADLDFMVRIDLADEGITHEYPQHHTKSDFARCRQKLISYINGFRAGVWVYEDRASLRMVGLIICRFRDLLIEPSTDANLFLLKHLDRSIFPENGRFTELYQLWVDPEFRRQGLATNLKRHIEIESLHRSVNMIYTHTEEANSHVIDLNLKLGYREVRRGPIWDEVIRVSLIKDLTTVELNQI